MTEVILHAKPMKSRFCAQINQRRQCLGQARQRFAAMTHRGFDSELYLAKSFIEWWIKKQRIVAKAVRSGERISDPPFAAVARGPF
jgi:hypothetical protein